MSDVKTLSHAIRKKCLDCCYGQRKEVELCPSKGCSLHPFRMGIHSEEQNSVTGKTKKSE